MAQNGLEVAGALTIASRHDRYPARACVPERALRGEKRARREACEAPTGYCPGGATTNASTASLHASGKERPVSLWSAMKPPMRSMLSPTR